MTTVPNSELVQEFTISAPINPTGAALSGTYSAAFSLPLSEDTLADYTTGLVLVIDRVCTDTLAAGAIDADNKRWAMTIALTSAAGTYGTAIMASTVIMDNDSGTKHYKNLTSGFNVGVLPSLATVPCPALYLTFTIGAGAVNLTTGNFSIKGRILKV